MTPLDGGEVQRAMVLTQSLGLLRSQADTYNFTQTLRVFGPRRLRLQGSRWRLFVAVGLVVAPYFPASNVTPPPPPPPGNAAPCTCC